MELRNTLPLVIRVIFADMQKSLVERFDGDKRAGRAAVCAFLFVRFIVPGNFLS